MLEYRQANRESTKRTSNPCTPLRRTVSLSSASSAAHAQTSGLQKFTDVRQRNAQRRSQIQSGLPLTLSSLTSHISAPELGSFPEDQESNSDHEQCEQEENKAAIDEELDKYIGSGVFDENDARWNDLDLIRYWQERQHDYPLLWQIAQDVLPAQASAVPCERVFSSSKETDALRRNSLSPLKMEVLQILKYIFRNDRLNFTEDLICTEAELLVADISTETIDYLMANGRGHELASMIDSSFESQRTSG